VGSSAAELAAGLGQVAAGIEEDGPDGSSQAGAERTTPGGVVFVFPGQGGQWSGMGRELLAREPVFRAELEAWDEAIRRQAGWSVLAYLREEEPVEDISRIQPALVALGSGLAALWRSWGIEPAAVVGHSLGEVAAAYVAGALSRADAVRIICGRSESLRRVSGQGQMAVVELTVEEAEAAIVGYEDEVSVAVSNSPQSTVLSGGREALEAIRDEVERKGIYWQYVKVDVASHSPQMDALRPELV